MRFEKLWENTKSEMQERVALRNWSLYIKNWQEHERHSEIYRGKGL
jgi:hypothetical protein